ncbi:MULTISPECIES: TetR/AcrR family transcriptional regulator [unclassified Streptomyces]|uniref:TetR/AcrR family transcriptional regulator n=1 Tax=unclassified Streptomyces TaxID=2593676 RepID=UPI00166036BE|nr:MULTISPECIES: TetR/AcrR family transcriptional regulator [unclassified Streptomyces]MBD0707424.1 TetR family transcriptional regulator [Streptomyces sp. CBMA291]MBD0715124.1 TetR family transcriptional regulator [Streptomyces sp. CBMA370]
MARNPERRTALLDAAIEVLADEGARGLTFRAVDVRAGVPTGTASNYFRDRDLLLSQVADRIFVRLTPPADSPDFALLASPGRKVVAELMRRAARRLAAERTCYLGLFELRLEAVRRPGLRTQLAKVLRSDLDLNVRTHLDAGMPGDADTVRLLYFALTGLLFDHFTVPELHGDRELDELIDTVVTRLVPEG